MSSIRVSVAIMAHPRRAAFIPDLQAALDRPATVVWDAGDNHRWNTGRRALLAYDPEATHHLVVQDDAIVCRDLAAGVEAALAHTPGDVPLCLYVGRVRPYRDVVEDYVGRARGGRASWLVMNQLAWGVAVVVPTAVIEAMTAWCETGTTEANYDLRLSAWFERQQLPVWYPWPSLVDHRVSPSLVPGRGHAGRVAHQFAGAETSALTLDYSGQVLRLPDLNRPGGHQMLYRCEKYDSLHIPTINVRFVDGFADVIGKSAMAYLDRPFMTKRGVRPATAAEEAAYRGLTAEPQGLGDPQPDGETPTGEQSGVVDAVETATVGGPGEASSFGTHLEAPAEPPEAGSGLADGADGVPVTAADVPDGPIADLQAWVGDDRSRARAALETEQGKPKPRATLLAALEQLLADEPA